MYLKIVIGGNKGLEWDHVIIVEQEKQSLKVQCKCRVVQILSSSEMCDEIRFKTKEISWPEYRLQIIFHI